MKGDDDTGRPDSAALRLRALTHPIRWKLIDLVAAEGSATATRCAEVLGESVNGCSYHLGILGKYGYLEPVPDVRGREKPWQLVASSLQGDLSPAEENADTELAAEAFLEHQLDRMKTRLRRRRFEPPEWQKAHLLGSSTMYVTAGELSEIKADLKAILTRYPDRADPGLRPADARLARVFVSSYLDPPQ